MPLVSVSGRGASRHGHKASHHEATLLDVGLDVASGVSQQVKTFGTRSATISTMKSFRWPSDKNELLKVERGISFEDITVAVEAGALLEVVPHPNPQKYPRQKVMVVDVAGYAYLVPFVEEDEHFFLKTIIPSRKATRDFITKESDDV